MFARLASILAVVTLAACAAEQSDDGGAVAADDALSTPDPAVEQARADGVVGEQATGYLAVVPGQTASRDLSARVADINIKRRAIYTQLSVERHVTVQTVAHAFACQLFATRVAVNQSYQDEDGVWRTRTAAAPMVMPSFCSP